MVAFWRQVVHHGAAPDDHPLPCYTEHLLHKPPHPGSGVAPPPKGLHRRVEGDDVREASRRIIELGYIGQPGGNPPFDQVLYEGRGVVVAPDFIVEAGEGYRPARHIQDPPLQIYPHLVQVALKPIPGQTTVSIATHQIYSPCLSHTLPASEEPPFRPGEASEWYVQYSLGWHIIFPKNNRFQGRVLTRPGGRRKASTTAIGDRVSSIPPRPPQGRWGIDPLNARPRIELSPVRKKGRSGSKTRRSRLYRQISHADHIRQHPYAQLHHRAQPQLQQIEAPEKAGPQLVATQPM